MEVYSDEAVSVHLGDARQLPVENASASLVVSSPPYNVGIGYEEGVSDQLDWIDYSQLALDVAHEAFRILQPGGRVFWNVVASVPEAPKAKVRVNLLDLWYNAFLHAGFDYWDTIAWVSKRGAGTAWGSWQRPSSPNLRGDWESILVLYKEHWTRKPPKAYEGWQDQLGGWTELVTNVWDIRPESRSKNGHPAPFPTELPSRAIRLSTWPGELVVDPFMGSGNTLISAKLLGRRAIGVDLSQTYAELAGRRCGQLVLPTAEPEEQPPTLFGDGQVA